jgi:hypothetical protein
MQFGQQLEKLHAATGSRWKALVYALRLSVFRSICRKMAIAPANIIDIFRQNQALGDVSELAADSPSVPTIAILLTGGLGDVIVAARYVRDLQRFAGPFYFDIYYSNIKTAAWIFQNIAGFRTAYSAFLFDHIRKRYPLAMWITQFVIYYRETALWTVLRRHAELIDVLRSIDGFRSEIEPVIRTHPYMDGYLSQKALYRNWRRYHFLHASSKVPYGGDELDLVIPDATVNSNCLRSREYITIHNGFDPDFETLNGTSTKCYPYFSMVVALIKAALPDIKVVQIGAATSARIDYVDVDFVDRLTLQQSIGLIKHAALHVDNESGLVHAARCVGVRSVVVFGPTPDHYFGYPGNINIKPAECGGCWWTSRNWMSKCPREFEQPVCMTSQPAETIADAVIRAITRNST